jgi:hypothetical protein
VGNTLSYDMLYGWDTAFVSSLDGINEMIVAQKTSPTRIDYTDPGPASGCSLKGPFGPWQLVADSLSAGGNLALHIPLNAATVVYPDAAGKLVSSSVTYTFLAVATIEFVDQPAPLSKPGVAPPPPTSSKLKHLRWQAASSNSSVQVTIVTNAPDDLQYAGGFLEAWLQDHMMEFEHVFAATTVGLSAYQADWQWLMPETVSYAVCCPQTGATTANSVFAVLCKLPGRSAAGLPQQISMDALPANSKYAFLLSEELAMAKLVKPAIAKAFFDIDESNLYLTAAPICLRNKATIKLPDLLIPIPQPAQGPGYTYQGKVPFKLPAPLATPSVTTVPGATIGPDNLTMQFDQNGLLGVDISGLNFNWPDGMTHYSVDANAYYAFTLAAGNVVDIEPSGDMTVSATVSLTKTAIQYEMYVAIALAVVQTIISVVPLGGVAGVVDTAAGTIATDAVAVDAQAAEASAGTAAEADAVAEMSAATGKGTAIKNFLLRFGKRFTLVLAAGAGNFLLTKWPEINRATQAGAAAARLRPTLSDLATQLLKANLWNNRPADAPKCTSVAVVNGCLQMGLAFQSKATQANLQHRN